MESSETEWVLADEKKYMIQYSYIFSRNSTKYKKKIN